MQQFVGAVGGRAIGCGGTAVLLPDGHGQGRQADADVFEGVKQEDAHDDCEEAAEGPNNVVRAHVLPLLEENGGAGEHRRGEEHVVDGRHQGGVEDVQSFVQVVDLGAHAAHQTKEEDPSQGVFEDVSPGDEFFNGDPQAFDTGHGERPDDRADGDVDEDVGLTVAGGHHKDEDESHDDNQGRKDEKP